MIVLSMDVSRTQVICGPPMITIPSTDAEKFILINQTTDEKEGKQWLCGTPTDGVDIIGVL